MKPILEFLVAVVSFLIGFLLAFSAVGALPVVGIGYAGGYIVVAQAGRVTTSVPVTIADSTGTSFNLPAGTYFARGAAGLTSLSVNGAAMQGGANDALALAASDTYIANYRQGPAVFGGFTPGQSVTVSMKRLAFDFGAGVGLDELNNSTTAALIASNFNTLSTRGGDYWADMEPTQGAVDTSAIDAVSDFAAAHGMHTRMHNGIWDYSQPSWVNALLTNAGNGIASAKTSLSAAITSRLKSILNDTHSHFSQMDVYDEQADSTGNNSYNTIYGQSGIAGIYNQAATLAPNTQMFVNGENGNAALLNGSDPGYVQNAGALIAAGGNVGGLGIEDYNSDVQVTPSLFMQNIQSLNVLGLPEEITEYGSHTSSNVDTTLSQALRMMFGNPNSEGFVLWEWIVDPSGYAAYSGLYNQSGSAYALTTAGQVWQNLVLNTWRTPTQTLTADSNGRIYFNGYYGDYLLNGQTVTFAKGAALPGDFNGDGIVDAGDYNIWRDTLGSTTDLRANGDNTGASAAKIDQADFNVWKANFGNHSGSGSSANSAVPEPASLLLFLCGTLTFCSRRCQKGRKLSTPWKVGDLQWVRIPSG